MQNGNNFVNTFTLACWKYKKYTKKIFFSFWEEIFIFSRKKFMKKFFKQEAENYSRRKNDRILSNKNFEACIIRKKPEKYRLFARKKL